MKSGGVTEAVEVCGTTCSCEVPGLIETAGADCDVVSPTAADLGDLLDDERDTEEPPVPLRSS